MLSNFCTIIVVKELVYSAQIVLLLLLKQSRFANVLWSIRDPYRLQTQLFLEQTFQIYILTKHF